MLFQTANIALYVKKKKGLSKIHVTRWKCSKCCDTKFSYSLDIIFCGKIKRIKYVTCLSDEHETPRQSNKIKFNPNMFPHLSRFPPSHESKKMKRNI
jgi:hypothetical protein